MLPDSNFMVVRDGFAKSCGLDHLPNSTVSGTVSTGANRLYPTHSPDKFGWRRQLFADSDALRTRNSNDKRPAAVESLRIATTY
jgi:hypothetical protein